MPANQRFFRTITLPMTDAEVLAMLKQHAAAEYEVEVLEETKKGAVKEWSTKIEAAQIKAKEFRDKGRTGTKEVSVECREVRDAVSFKVEVYRIDIEPHVLIDSRDMSTEERNKILNPTLPFVPADPPKDDDLCTVCEGAGEVQGRAGEDGPECPACGGTGERDVQRARAEASKKLAEPNPLEVASDAFGAPAPSSGVVDNRDAFLAGGDAHERFLRDKTATIAPVGPDAPLPPVPPPGPRPVAAPLKLEAAGSADFADPWDAPVGDVTVPANAAAKGARKKKNGKPDDAPPAA